MRVYLDSGDIANLEKLEQRASGEFASFIDEWRSLGCTLALSTHHAQEIAQLADDSSRTRRLDIIGRFPAIEYDQAGSHAIVVREGLHQLEAHLNGTTPDYEHHLRPQFFTIAGIEPLKVAVLELGDFLRALSEAQATTAAARNSNRGQRPPHSFRRQKRDRVDMEAAKDALESFLAAEDVSPGVEQMMRGMHHILRTNMASSPHLRSAMEKAYGIEGFLCLKGLGDEHLPRVGTFFLVLAQAISELAADLGIDPAPLLAALPELDPFDCPGWRCEAAVSQGQDDSNQNAVSGDEADRAHISFLPYVDALFADKRTVTFFEQEAHNGIRPDRLTDSRTRLQRSCDPQVMLGILHRIARDAA